MHFILHPESHSSMFPPSFPGLSKNKEQATKNLVLAISIVRRARAFARDHRGAEWFFRRAELAEGFAVAWLFQSLHDQSADADFALLGGVVAQVVAQVGVKLGVFFGDRKSATANLANAAPL